jgi:hypothetical protein
MDARGIDTAQFHMIPHERAQPGALQTPLALRRTGICICSLILGH